jgi:hypothetical protein
MGTFYTNVLVTRIRSRAVSGLGNVG